MSHSPHHTWERFIANHVFDRKIVRHLLAERMFHQLDAFVVVDLMMGQWSVIWERCLLVVSGPADRDQSWDELGMEVD